jgi:deoxyribose-phosphate aldolase
VIFDGATEVDMVINVGALKSGDLRLVERDVESVVQPCRDAGAISKVIIEAAYLTDEEKITACTLAKAAGADFVKTSTGKIPSAATPPVVLVMLEAVRDFYYATGRRVGVKAAGGVRTAKQALHYLVLVKETLGDAWLTPDLFRIGASALANDLLMQIAKEMTGRYQSTDYFTKD